MVKFKSVFDHNYLSDGLQAHIKLKLRIFKFMPYVGFGYLLFIVAISILESNSFSIGILDAAVIGSLIIFPYLYYFINTLNFKNNALYNKELNWEITPETIKGYNENLNFSVKWINILEAYTLRNGLIIYPTKNSYYWFPKYDFEKENSINEIVEFVKSNRVKHLIKH